jgi:hypothetical protein
MSGRKYLLDVTCLCAAVFLSGCIVVSSDSVPVEVAEVEIGCAPPPPPVVVVTRPPPPSGLHIWIGGQYVVGSGAWVWVEGHWAQPPHRGAVWTPGHTRQSGHVYHWRPGHWR